MAMVMDRADWRRLKKLYFTASELDDRERRRLVDKLCPRGDPLRDQLDRLLLVDGYGVKGVGSRFDARRRNETASVAVIPVAGTKGYRAQNSIGRARPENGEAPIALQRPALDRWGDLVLIEEVGQGSFGTVYRGHDPRLQRPVAVKILRRAAASDAQLTSRLLQEGRALARIRHSNVVCVYEAGEHEGRCGLAMEFVRGMTLEQMLDVHGPFSAGEARLVGYELCGALAAVHREGLIHCDLKAQNVMREVGGRLVLMDFGAGQQQRRGAADPVAGTPLYLSPEVLAGGGATVSSDIYSVGVLLYHLVTRDFPVKADTLPALMKAHTRGDIMPVQDVRPNLPVSFVRIVECAMHRDPARRYPSAMRMATALARISGSQPGLSDVPRLRAPGRPTRRPARPDRPGRQLRSVAVLPFTDMSPAKDQESFCDGITDELIYALSQLPRLRVAARTSTFQFKGQAPDARQIGKVLNVATVLDGTVRKDGDRLKVTVELIGTVDGYLLWSQSFDRSLVDVFAVQDEIARAVVMMLTGDAARRIVSSIAPNSRDLEAYCLYLEGRYHWNKRTEGELERSLGCFEQAIQRDPAYAHAYVGLADAYLTLGTYGAMPSREVTVHARCALKRAFEIETSLAEAYACRGCLSSVYDWSWSKADRDFRRAIELNPSYSTAHHWYAINYLVLLARFEEAREELQRALDLDPLALSIRTSLGMNCYFARNYEAAIRELTKTIEFDGTFGLARLFLGATHTELGGYDQARQQLEAALQLSGRRPEILGALGYLHGRAGDAVGARRILIELTRLARERYVSPVRRAQVHVGLGQRNEALTELEKAYGERAADLAWLGVRPTFASLHAEPRFKSLLAQLHLPG
jgi:serine/threonine-protein kinase